MEINKINAMNKTFIPLIISCLWLIVSVIEVLIGFIVIGRKGVNSFFVVETGIIACIAFIYLISLLIMKKFDNKLLLITLVVLLISMLSVFAQFLPASLSSTMPYRYSTMGGVYGLYYRIDLMQGADTVGEILELRSVNYIININLIFSIFATLFNSIIYVKTKKVRKNKA